MALASRSSNPFPPQNAAVSTHAGDTQEADDQSSSSNRRRVWTAERDNQLRDLVEKGKSSRWIAFEMRSTLSAVRMRRHMLKLKSPLPATRASLWLQIKSMTTAGYTRKQVILKTGASSSTVARALTNPGTIIRREPEPEEKIATLKRMVEDGKTRQEIVNATNIKNWRVAELVKELYGKGARKAFLQLTRDSKAASGNRLKEAVSAGSISTANEDASLGPQTAVKEENGRHASQQETQIFSTGKKEAADENQSSGSGGAFMGENPERMFDNEEARTQLTATRVSEIDAHSRVDMRAVLTSTLERRYKKVSTGDLTSGYESSSKAFYQPSPRRRVWTEPMIEEFRDLAKKGESNISIASKMGKTVGSIAVMRSRLKQESLVSAEKEQQRAEQWAKKEQRRAELWAKKEQQRAVIKGLAEAGNKTMQIVQMTDASRHQVTKVMADLGMTKRREPETKEKLATLFEMVKSGNTHKQIVNATNIKKWRVRELVRDAKAASESCLKDTVTPMSMSIVDEDASLGPQAALREASTRKEKMADEDQSLVSGGSFTGSNSERMFDNEETHRNLTATLVSEVNEHSSPGMRAALTSALEGPYKEASSVKGDLTSGYESSSMGNNEPQMDRDIYGFSWAEFYPGELDLDSILEFSWGSG